MFASDFVTLQVRSCASEMAFLGIYYGIRVHEMKRSNSSPGGSPRKSAAASSQGPGKVVNVSNLLG